MHRRLIIFLIVALLASSVLFPVQAQDPAEADLEMLEDYPAVHYWFASFWGELENTRDAANEYLHEDYSYYDPTTSYSSPQEHYYHVSLWRRYTPDFTGMIHEVVAEDGSIAVRYTVWGTGKTSGQEMRWTGIVMFHLEDEKGGDDWLAS